MVYHCQEIMCIFSFRCIKMSVTPSLLLTVRGSTFPLLFETCGAWFHMSELHTLKALSYTDWVSERRRHRERKQWAAPAGGSHSGPTADGHVASLEVTLSRAVVDFKSNFNHSLMAPLHAGPSQQQRTIRVKRACFTLRNMDSSYQQQFTICDKILHVLERTKEKCL